MISLFFLFSITFVQSLNFKECNVPYCKECSTAGTCTSCFTNYILQNGQCKFKRELGCEQYTISNNDYICYVCSDGYKMNVRTGKGSEIQPESFLPER